MKAALAAEPGDELLRLDLRLRVAATPRLDAPAPRLGDPAELLEDLLAVRHAAADLLERFGRQQERRLRHQRGRLAARVVQTLHEAVVDGARGRDDLRRGYARHRDAVLVDLGGEALGEPLERRLLGAIARPA